jgi:CheY-like chemotaxis protein
VVEDEPTVAQLIVDVLKEEGHHAEAVLDSQEGLTLLSRSRYDLVICDVRMPRLDGPAFYDALVRAGSPIRDKILFTTGDMLAPRTTQFLEPNGLPYLAKPFLVEELKLAVNRLLVDGRKRAAKDQVGGAAKGRIASPRT